MRTMLPSTLNDNTLEVLAQPCNDTIPLIIGLDTFTGGEPGNWTVDGINYATYWGQSPTNSRHDGQPVLAQHFVVINDVYSLAEIDTYDFYAALTEFANSLGGHVEVKILRTEHSLRPKGTPSLAEHPLYFGKGKRLTTIWITTPEFLKLPEGQGWDNLLNKVFAVQYGSKPTPEGDKLYTQPELASLLSKFASKPEVFFAERDNVWGPRVPINEEFVTVVRNDPNNASHPAGRMFIIEGDDERYRRLNA